MKATLKTLQRESLRNRPITENETSTFSNLEHIRRYFPAMDVFPSNDNTSIAHTKEFPSTYYIHEWKSEDNGSKCYDAIRKKTGENTEEPCRVFAKTIHLLNPIDFMKERYQAPTQHPLLPEPNYAWESTVHKLHSRNNQAYVDTVANYVLSRFRELDLTPHCILYYGSYSGIAKKYLYNISGEYDTYRNCKWFWKGIKKYGNRLTLSHPDKSIWDNTRYHEFYKEITECPFTEDELNNSLDLDDFEEMEEELNEMEELDVLLSSDSNSQNNTIQEINDVLPVEEITDIIELQSEDCTDIHEESSCEVIETDSNIDILSESSHASDDSTNLDIDICIEVKNTPVITILQEAHEGVMDDLVLADEVDGCEAGTDAWEGRWIAWMFQVIAMLTFLQSSIHFTHNDLHSNNILWRSTTQRFLYYRTNNGKIWRVPTFGKIFSIIDFGRAIFRLGPNQWISDDHWPDQDAGDQYNFGPFYDSSKPKVEPNPSFDLCRLAVSLIDGLFGEYPEKKKGKKVSVLSKEEDWIMYETCSPLFNLLWSWTVDDSGATIYETRDGEEKYDGFELYIRISKDVHSAIPKEQLYRTIFHPYLWKGKIPSTEKVYRLGV